MSKLLNTIDQSYSVAFADHVRQLEYSGLKVFKVQTGDPEYPTHERIVEAAQEALSNGETNYCDSRGLKELRLGIVRKLQTFNKIDCLADENVLVTHGAVHGISIAIKAILNPGDECIIIEPYWRSYESNVILAGGIPIMVRLSEHNGFQLNADLVLASITERTRLVIINTPNNPSGAIYDKHELSKLSEFVAKKSIYLISDEVYEAITLDGQEHYSMASDPRVFPWVISIFSFSKTYAMTGWRIGYLVASKALIDNMLKLSQYSATCISPFIQKAAITALSDITCAKWVDRMRVDYRDKREFLRNLIENTWLEFRCLLPQGAFYVLIDISEFNKSSFDLAKVIASRYSVSFTPGIAFGDSMDGYLRLSLTAPIENIKEAITSLVKYRLE